MKFEDLPAFEGPGKTYHGIRYPNKGTIIAPLCVVTVIPEDGRPYRLMPRYDLLMRPKKRRLHEANAALTAKALKFGCFDWGCKGKEVEHLAAAMLDDMLKNTKLAKRLYKDFAYKVIAKLPQMEFKINGPKDILMTYDCEIVLAAMEGIK